jgi:4'-phosphopantetheinyl transferase
MAVASDREVGIDIERHRPEFATDNLAEQFFSPDEVRAIRCLPAEDQERAFFDCWTRKEAYIKARGQGLSIALNQFTVAVSGEQTSVLLSTAHDPGAVTKWRVCEIEAPVGFSAALAYEFGSSTPKLVAAY